ncbi:MAG: hypothetical protein IID30_05870 [Planctomycetes bacterium]|nr:hypothetical protein [Planctomycetota bacterium]
MRRVLVFLIFACLTGLLTRAASGQPLTVELSFLVSEDSFQALVDDLELQGELLDDARALWGPYFFDLTQAQVTYEAFLPWHNLGLPRYRELSGKFREFNTNSPQWNLRQLEILYAQEQRRLTKEYFDGMRRLAPYKAEFVDARQRTMTRRSFMRNKWQVWQIIGAHADLIRLTESLSRAHSVTALGRSHWTEDFRAILDAYERELDGLLIEFDRLYMKARYPEPPPPRPKDPDKLREWWKKRIVRPSHYAKILLPIRKLNQATTRKMEEALPTEEAEILLERANVLISPFAYRTQGWQFWIKQALKQDGIDDDQRDALLAQREMYERDSARHIDRLVRLYDIRSTPAQFEKARRYADEIQQELRAESDSLTEEQLAFNAAIEEFENFDRMASAKIRPLLGLQADTLSAVVQAQLDTQDRELRKEQESQISRKEFEEHVATLRPRHTLPFIDRSEFTQCVESIAFADDERRAIFKSLYDDFHDGFTSSRKTYEENRLIARARDILENPQPPRDGNSSTIIITTGPRPSPSHSAEWNQRWIKLRLTLERDFDDQVRLFLSEAEQLIWDMELRRLRRIRMIPNIQFYLQPRQKRYAYDVIEMINTLELKSPDEAGFSKLMLECEFEFDSAFRRFEVEYEAVTAEVFAAITIWRDTGTQKDADKSSRLSKKLLDIREGILTVSRRYIPAIADALDDRERQRFQDAIDTFEFPWLYIDSPYDLCCAALKRDQSLEDEQFLALAELETQFDVTRSEFRRRYLALIRRYDKEKDRERRQTMIEDIYQMALKRTFIEQDACDDLLRLIPPHQHEELALDIRMLLATFP